MIARLLAWFAPSALATAAAVGAALLAALGAQTLRLHSTQADLAAAKSVFAAEKQAALTSALRESEANRAEEQRRTAAHQEIVNESTRHTARARADAAGAAGAGRRMQQRFAAAVVAICPATSNPGIAASGPPASDASRVLTVVFGEIEARVRALDRVADERGLAGTTCQKSYDALEQ